MDKTVDLTGQTVWPHKRYRPRLSPEACRAQNLLPLIYYRTRRRYYSQLERCYITLDAIAECWCSGMTIRCVGDGDVDMTLMTVLRVLSYLEQYGRFTATQDQLRAFIKQETI